MLALRLYRVKISTTTVSYARIESEIGIYANFIQKTKPPRNF